MSRFKERARGSSMGVILLIVAVIAIAAYFIFKQGKSAPGGSALDLAKKIPANVTLVSAWSLEGQVDLTSWVRDFREISGQVDDSAKQDLVEFEKELGMPLEEWIALFDGQGFFAVLKTDDPKKPGGVAALGLADGAKFKTWWEAQSAKYPSEPESKDVDGVPFKAYPEGGFVGLDANWLYIADGDTSAKALVSSVAGKSANLASTPRFQEGVKSLATSGSATFGYLDTETLLNELSDGDIPYTDAKTFEELAPIKYIIGSADFRNPQMDALVKIEGDSLLAKQLMKPGGVDPEVAKLIGAKVTSYSSIDVRWVMDTLLAFGGVSPETRSYAAMAPMMLMSYNPWAALSGQLTSANDIPEAMVSMASYGVESSGEGRHIACKSNLMNIGTAMEMYSTDWSGFYAPEPSLLTPNYLRTIPECPAAGTDTYSSTFDVKTSPDSFTVHCSGSHHEGGQADYPRYDSTSGIDAGEYSPPGRPEEPMPSAFVVAPVKDLAKAHELLGKAISDGPSAPPAAGEEVKYPVPEEGSSLILSGKEPAKILFSSGPKAEQLQDTSSGNLASNALLKKSVSWGGKGIVYVDYLDLEPTYDSALKALKESKEDNAPALASVLTKIRARVPSLQGSSCVTITAEGVRYRAYGASNLSLLGGTGVLAAVLVPNFIRARGQGQTTACKSNLKNISTALEMYSTDWSGNYPVDTTYLTPNYLKTIPECPSAGGDTYSASYSRTEPESEDGWGGYEFYCNGHNHEQAGLGPNFPAYNSKQGLLEREGW